MDDTKPFWQSTTLQGILMLLVPIVARWLGYQVDSDSTAFVVANILTVLGAIMAIVGRVTARHELTVTAPPKVLAWLLLAGYLATGALLSGCANSQTPRLPSGSYAEASGYAKDSDGKQSVGIKGTIHIPLSAATARHAAKCGRPIPQTSSPRLEDWTIERHEDGTASLFAGEGFTAGFIAQIDAAAAERIARFHNEIVAELRSPAKAR